MEVEVLQVVMDLDPDKPRFRPGVNNTAGQDWYILYVEGGLLRRRLEQETKRVANLPKIKGFKGTLTARKELGL